MGYHIRVFCTSDNRPDVRKVIDHINSLGYTFNATTNLTADQETVNTWTDFELKYKKDKLPILVECNVVSDSDQLATEEIQEFLENIGRPTFFSTTKKKIIAHLNNTKYIIANQLPTSDIDNDGYDVNGEFLKYFVDNYGGMIHADGEGFYSGEKIILETD